MAQLEYPVVSTSGSEVGKVVLDPEVFGVAVDPSLVHAVVRWQRAKRRAGTHSTLTKSEVSGGGKKPWRQKGTGRARAGSNTSPLWVGGGVTFGPKPRSYEFSLNKKVRHQALAAVLSDKLREGKVKIVAELDVPSSKTRDGVKVISAVTAEKDVAPKAYCVVPGGERGSRVNRSLRNVPGVIASVAQGVNVYDIVRHEYLVLDKDVIETITARVKGKEA